MSLYKKGGFRRMNQMNGDFLTQLKEPLRSEMNRTVLGTNQAFVSVMNKSLDLYYKEQNINMEALRRRQGDVYGTMLRVHRDKKLFQRAAYKRNQQESRGNVQRPKDSEADVLSVALHKLEGSNASETQAKDVSKAKQTENTDKHSDTVDNVNTSDAVDSNTVKAESSETTTKKKRKKKPKVTKTFDEKAGSGTSTQDNSKLPVEDKCTIPPTESDDRRDHVKTSRVLEVSKNAPLAPIVRERSTLTAEDLSSPATDSLRLSPSKPRNTALAPLPETLRSSNKEVSISDIAIDSVAEAQAVSRGDQPQQRMKLESLNGEHNKRLSMSSVAMPTISESKGDLVGRNIVTRHSDGSLPEEKIPKKKRKKIPPIQPAYDEHPATPILPDLEPMLDSGLQVEESQPDIIATKPLSQVEKNRKRALRKLRHRHKILNEEQLHVYVKSSNGTYIPSLTPFRRKEFAPPSMREKHMQEKMLRAQIQARLDQRRKLEDFFERMAQEERERQKLREAFKRVKEQEAEEARRKLAEQEQKLGFSASQLATMYSRGVLPPGVDPTSFEAIAYCKYIRTYSPTADKEHGEDNKHSSWS